MSDELVPAYIGRCKTCKGVNAAMVDDDESDPKEVARFVADLAKRGHVIERSTVGFVRTSAADQWCSCRRSKPKATQEALAL